MSEAVRQPVPNGIVSSAKGVEFRTWLALIGIILAVMASGIGENVSKVALADIEGAMSLNLDDGSWIICCYIIGFVLGSGFTPCFWPTFSLRRVALFMAGLYILCGVLTPYISQSYSSLLIVRSVQGLTGGAMPPMLMTIVLRFMPPLLKVPVLGAYALVSAWSATLGATIAALSFSWGWQGYFYWNIPVMLLAMFLLGYGLPQDPMKLERLQHFDWKGLITGTVALGMLSMGLYQGERWDWFNSPLISFLLLGGLGLLVIFLVNEWSQPIPFFNLQLLKKLNLSFSLIALGCVLVLMVALISLTSGYLAAVQGYRQEQISDVMLWVALPQLIVLPIMSYVCNLQRVDCRIVLIIGLSLMALASYMASQLTSDWSAENFRLIQLIQAAAQPMMIIPLLMLATIGLQPTDGPFAAAWFNAVKGFAATVAVGVTAFMLRIRGDFHHSQLVNQQPTTGLEFAEQSAGLMKALSAQVKVLATADVFIALMVFIALLVALTCVMPGRVYPPTPN
ncbi:MFS transporter [Pseudomonas sp. F1_0610]|uniref:MFS transporter n=1 Tax=Pseudomonas sp. F1_0610 TaxID=3114284 RepID=UPI0039C0691F